MNRATALIRIAIQSRWDWTDGERDETVSSFIHETLEAVTPRVLEDIADNYPERFTSMFVDWAKFRRVRTREQRVNLMIQHVAKNATGLPFGYARAFGDTDVAQSLTPINNKVVSLY